LQAVGQLAHGGLAEGLDLEEVDDVLDEFSRCAISSRSAGPQRSACRKRLLFILRLRPVMMLSITLMPLNSARFWKVRATPISATWRLFMWLKVLPRKVMLPSCGRVDAVDAVEHRALAGAVGADDGADLVLAHVEAEMSVSAFTPPKRRLMFLTSRMTSPIFF
jgi:hypothetical protein